MSRRRRLLVDDEALHAVSSAPPSPSSAVPLAQEEQHYARRVLRLNDHDAVQVFDGRGGYAEAVLYADEVRLQGPVQHEPASNLLCAIPQPKGDRAGWLVEKLTELGVDSIAWLSCDHAQVRPEKGQRLARRVLAAARQCGRARLPKIYSLEFAELLRQAETALAIYGDPEGEPLIPFITRCASPSKESRPKVLAIGPEGGFTAAEVASLDGTGFRGLELGPWILRSETAALVAVGVIAAL